MFRKGFARCPLDGAPLYEISADPLEGSIFADRYVIEQCVGEGGMGRVYRASHRHMSRLFAIKILFGEHAAEKEMQVRFAREAEAACRLTHPNVVSVIDFGATERGLFYLVMDWVEGGRLTDVVCTEAPLSPSRIVDITRQICQGLAHAHDQGLVHRDLKSENIIISHEGGRELVRLVDFGLAVVMESDANSRLTAEGTVYGTPAYMSPEQACGAKLDGRTDIFSLGVLMYEMLCGMLPFSGAPMDIVRQNMETEPPTISERVPGLTVNRNLEMLARKLMAKRPPERYQSAAEILTVLDEIQAEWTTPSRSLPRSTQQIPRTQMVYLGNKPMRWVRVAVVALLLSVAGIAAALFVPGVMQRLTGTAEPGGEPAGAAAPGDAAGATPGAAHAGTPGAARPPGQEGAPGGQPGVQPDGPGDDPPEPPAGQDDPVAAVAGAAGTDEDPEAVEPTRQNRRRPPRQRRDEPRTGTSPDRQPDPAPNPGGTVASEPVASEDISPAKLEALYREVGRLMDCMAKERPGPEADALSTEYFRVAFSASETNAKLRPDVWEQLQRLRQRARRELK